MPGLQLEFTRLVYESDEPVKGKFVFLDIQGDKSVRYQVYKTDDNGNLITYSKEGGKAKVIVGEYNVYITDSHVMEGTDSIEGKNLFKEFTEMTVEIVKGDSVIKELKGKTQVLEFEDALFHHNSGVLMPTEPEGPSSEDGEEPKKEMKAISGLSVLMTVYTYSKANPDKKLIIAGHTDTTGEPKYNFQLSMYRAYSVYHLLMGKAENRRKWAENSNAKNKTEDYQQIFKHFAEVWGWDCDPGKVDNKKGIKTYKATRNFQKKYSKEFDKKVYADGIVGKKTWGAIYDCYRKELAQMMSTEDAGLAKFSDNIKLVTENYKVFACGESAPIEEEEKDNFRSQTNRRVEILFFDEGEEPTNFKCPSPNGPYKFKTCDLNNCPFYKKGRYTKEYIDPDTIKRIDCFLKFKYHDLKNDLKNLNDGTLVEACDGEVTKVIGQNRTKGERVKIVCWGVDENDPPDVFFNVKLKGTKLEGQDIGANWSSKDDSSTTETKGFFKDYKERNLGKKNVPLVYHIQPWDRVVVIGGPQAQLTGARDEAKWLARKDWFNVDDPAMSSYGAVPGKVDQGQAGNYLEVGDWDKYFTMKHLDGFEKDKKGKPKKLNKNQISEAIKYKNIWHQASHGTVKAIDPSDNNEYFPCHFCERRKHPPGIKRKAGGCRGTNGKIIGSKSSSCSGNIYKYAYLYWCRWENDVEGSPGWRSSSRDPEDFNKSEVGFYGTMCCDGNKAPRGEFDFITPDDFTNKIDTPSKLLFASCCQTARSPKLGEKVSGLGEYYLGAPINVYDNIGTQFTRAFYQRIIKMVDDGEGGKKPELDIEGAVNALMGESKYSVYIKPQLYKNGLRFTGTNLVAHRPGDIVRVYMGLRFNVVIGFKLDDSKQKNLFPVGREVEGFDSDAVGDVIASPGDTFAGVDTSDFDIFLSHKTGTFDQGEVLYFPGEDPRIKTKKYQKMIDQTGNFQIGETITGETSGATATVTERPTCDDVGGYVINDFQLFAGKPTGTFQKNEKIVGKKSKAEANITEMVVPMFPNYGP